MRRVIAWKLEVPEPTSAPVRYRALFPAEALRARGWDSVFLQGAETLRDFGEIQAMVFVRTFDDADRMLAQRAAERGVPVIVDLCDNIFVDGYRGWIGASWRRNFQSMLQLCSALVVTGRELAARLDCDLPAGLPIVEIPDPVETPEATRAALDVRRWRSVRADLRLRGDPLASLAYRLRQDAKRLRRLRRSIQAVTLGSHGRRGGMNGTAATAAAPDRKRVVWFGADYGSRWAPGLRPLAALAGPLSAVCRTVPFELTVISNNAASYRRLIRPLPFPTRFRQWSPLGVFDALAGADAALLPYAADEFGIVKSANRVVLALSLGVPVVASSIPALRELEGCLMLDDWEAGLRRYLTDPEFARQHVRQAQAIIGERFSAASVAERWDRLLAGLVRPELRQAVA